MESLQLLCRAGPLSHSLIRHTVIRYSTPPRSIRVWPMAGQEAWWLQKNSLIGPLADANRCEVIREFGAFDPDLMLPHVQKPQPPQAHDQGKQEVFGGGRRPRRHSSDEPEPPAPYGVVSRSPRRHSSDEIKGENALLPMPSWSGAPRVEPSTDWRMGDSHPFTLDGSKRSIPDSPRKEPGTEWRMGDDQPLSVILHREQPVDPTMRYRPPAKYNTEWRKPVPGLTNELMPENNMSPASRQRILASRQPASILITSPRSSGWRLGTEQPLKIADDLCSELRSPRRNLHSTNVNESTWRMGDPQPFRMDGGAAEREAVSGAKAGSDWRKGDTRPMVLGDGQFRELKPSPRMSKVEEKVAIRERRISTETESLVEQLANFGQSTEVNRDLIRLRRGENFYGPAMPPR